MPAEDSESEIESRFWGGKAETLFSDAIKIGVPPAVQRAIESIRDGEAETVLDCGCGSGISSAMLAKRFKVHGFDVSQEMIELAESFAREMGVEGNTHFQVTDFYSMDYEDEMFDLAFGGFIVHHLGDKEKAGREVCRVLRPGAKAIFVETWEGNPLLKRLRPFVLKTSPNLRTLASPGEHPLNRRDIEAFCRSFSEFRLTFPHFQFWQLGSDLTHLRILRGIRKIKWLASAFQSSLQFLDKLIYVCFPFLRKYSYHVVIVAVK